MRFKYHPDNALYINNEGKQYFDTYANFVIDIAALSIENPLTEGAYIEYIPDHKLDRIDGIVSGWDVTYTHTLVDQEVHPEYDIFITNLDGLLAQQIIRNHPAPLVEQPA